VPAPSRGAGTSQGLLAGYDCDNGTGPGGQHGRTSDADCAVFDASGHAITAWGAKHTTCVVDVVGVSGRQGGGTGQHPTSTCALDVPAAQTM